MSGDNRDEADRAARREFPKHRSFGPEPNGLIDLELCLAWRRSFVTLRHASDARDRLGVVELRQRYLDELEQRHPFCFRRWLDSGARAAGDPSRYLPKLNTERGNRKGKTA